MKVVAASVANVIVVCLSLLSFPIQTLHLPLPLPSPSSILPSHLLKDVLKAICLKHGWELEQIRATNVDDLRVGGSQRYEFRVRMGKTDLVFKFSEELGSWKKISKDGDLGPLLHQLSSKTVLNRFQLDGPFELTVSANHHLSLALPLNVTHTGLKRLLVGEGITVEVEGAREVSLFHASDFGLGMNRSSNVTEGRNPLWPFRQSSCLPFPPVHIVGSASVAAYRGRNPNAYIETAFPARDIVELLPEKCYSGHLYKKRGYPIRALSLRLALLEKLMKNFLGDRINQNGVSGFLKAKIKSSTLVQFQLELERDVGDDDAIWGTVEEWKTKPTMERLQFEVMARVEAERLKPVVLKKVRPFVSADSTTWSTLMSNISFTNFPSFLVPPEALTLDVKW